MDSTTPPTILTTPTTNKKQRDSPNISHLRKTTKAATILFHSEKMVAPLFLSRQRELHGESEVVGRGGVRAGREQWGIGLTVVVGRERQQA